MSKYRYLAMVSSIALYAAIRVMSYLVFNPRPYLWWHAILDFVLLSILALPFLLAKETR